MSQLLQTLKVLTQQTVAEGTPCNYLIGVVETESPLSIRIDQKEVLPAEFLVLTDAVRDYNVDITVNHTTENRGGGAGYAEFQSHNHGYSGRKRITVHNALHAGESVLLVQQEGGQEFIVLSRIFDHTNLSGQWG